VNVYLPELSAVVVVTCWKFDCWASFRHSATVAPEVAVPEITTFCPALDGLGEAVMVRAAVGQGVGEQHVVPVDGQHVV
jgi:hypothetical protein